MDDDIEWYTPTENELETIDRAGLSAAWRELQPLKKDELPLPHKVLACLRAFRAAEMALNVAKKTLGAAHPEAQYVMHYPDTTDMVCSALMGLDITDDPNEIHPSSVLGGRLSALLKAARALEAMSTVHSAFDDFDGVFGTYLADETTALAEAAIRGRKRKRERKQ